MLATHQKQNSQVLLFRSLFFRISVIKSTKSFENIQYSYLYQGIYLYIRYISRFQSFLRECTRENVAGESLVGEGLTGILSEKSSTLQHVRRTVCRAVRQTIDTG